MGYQIYLKLDGIAGECANPTHKDWILIDTFSQNVAGPDRRGGAAILSELSITRMADRATPLLAQATAEGRHFREAVFELCMPDGALTKYMEVRLTNVTPTNFTISASSPGDGKTPFESLMLRFEKVEWLYYPNAFIAGKEKEVVVSKASWNLEEALAAR